MKEVAERTTIKDKALPHEMNVHPDILSTVGDTPLVRLNRIVPEGGAMVCAKLEMFNPTGSIKDRTALAMVEEAEKEGKLKPGSMIAEATSGNLGLGLAMVAAVRGYQVVLFVEEIDRLDSFIKTAHALGADVVTTTDFMTAVRLGEQFQIDDPDVFVPQQFKNTANPDVHERQTAEEIIRDAGPRLRAFVASFGSGGTFTGISRSLKRYKPDVEVVLVEPDTVPLFSGGEVSCSAIHGIGPTFRPDVMSSVVYDSIMQVSGEDAHIYMRRLAREEGIFCGPSSGALACAAVQVAARYQPGDVIVTIFPDAGNRYLGSGFYT